MKQGIKTRLFGSLMSLSVLKAQGFKVGRLKFKGQVDSMPLKAIQSVLLPPWMENSDFKE